MSRKTILIIMAISVLFAISFNRGRISIHHKNLATEIFESANVNANDYLRGINLHRPVGIYVAKEGEVFIQYQIPNAPQGNFYGLEGSTPNQLGINEYGYDPQTEEKVKKEIRIYKVVKETEMLSSFAAPTVDDWSTPEDEARTDGSELQFFTTCKDCFQQIH